VARLTLMIANGGTVRQPYLVARVSSADGRVLATGRGAELGAGVSAQTAETVAGMMVGVVEKGTGRSAAIRGVSVAGKTGSAENPEGEPHSWFTAFAPADGPRVVVTAVVEHGGAGAEAAAPIVREVMQELLSGALSS
jgi:peptidoglycan glycosyltransferase